MSARIPAWFLDVDGVINMMPDDPDALPFYFKTADVYSPADETTYPVRWRPEIMRRVVEINASGLAQIVWASTWCVDIDWLTADLGLPTYPRAFVEPLKGRLCSMAKLSAVAGELATGRRVIWTDDQEAAAGGVRDALTFDGQALLIAPDKEYGLTHADLDKIEEFCKR